jgi:hypothetical protein
MAEQGLGDTSFDFSNKKYYFFWIIGIMLFLFWARIGTVAQQSRSMIDFYILFGFFGLIIMLADNLAGKRLPFIDSVSVEKTPKTLSFLTPKMSLVLALVFGIILSIRILQTQTAWIAYPSFSLLTESKYFSATLSGLVGVLENVVFFGCIFPIIYKNLVTNRNKISAFLISTAVTSFIFMIFHIFTYSNSVNALAATAFFALINCSLVAVTRNLIFSDSLHFFNNFISSTISAKLMLFFKL